MDKNDKEYSELLARLDAVMREVDDIKFQGVATMAVMNAFSTMVETYGKFAQALAQVAMGLTLSCEDKDTEKAQVAACRIIRTMRDMLNIRVKGICEDIESGEKTMYGGAEYRDLVKEIDRAKSEPGYDPRAQATKMISKMFPDDPEQQSKLLGTLDSAMKELEAKGFGGLMSPPPAPDEKFKYI